MKITSIAVAALLLAGPALADDKLEEEIDKAEKDLREGDVEDAVKRLTKYADKNPSGASYVALAEILARAGTVGGGGMEAAAAAVDQAVRAARGGTDKAHALAAQARFDLLRGTGAEAVEHAQQAVALEADAETLHALTLAQVRVQNYRAAMESADRALEAQPASPLAHAAQGAALLGSGRAADAAAAYRKALEADPDLISAQIGLADALSQAGQHSEAIAAARKATEMNPWSAEAYAALGLAIMREAPEDPQHLNEAIGEAQQGKFLNDRSVVAQQAVGRIFEARGDLNQAQMAYEAALKVDPGYVPARAALIQTKVRRQDYQGALADVQELVRETPTSAIAHLQHGRVLMRAERFSDALEPLEKAVELAPDMAEAQALLGTVYQYNGRTTDAASAYAAATRLDPDNNEYRAVYGLLLGMTGRYAEGAAELERVTSDPSYEDAAAWVNLGWIHRNSRPRDPDGSVRAYSRALEIDPDNAQAALGLGWAYSYVQPRQWAKARAAFEKAAKLDAALAGEAYSGIGWVCFFNQDIACAQEYLEKARAEGRFDRRLAENIQRVETEKEAMEVVLAYQQLQPKMTYDQVVEILGRPGEEIDRKGPNVTYQWNNPDNTYVVVLLQNGQLVDKLHTGLEEEEEFAAAEEAPIVTRAHFNRIQKGMTLEQVNGIIGTPGREHGRTYTAGVETVFYLWQNGDGSSFTGTFQKGKLVDKNQSGL